MTNSESRGNELPESRSLRQRAEKMLHTSRDEIAGMSSEDIQRMFHELQVHQIELKLQNEELRDAQLELARSRDLYSNLYEFAPVGYLMLDSKGSILQANLTMAEMLRVDRSGLLGRKLAEFATQGSSDELHRHLQSVFSTDTKITSELTMIGADETGRVFQLESRAVSDDRGDGNHLNSLLCRTAIIDVTEQREATEWIVQAKRLRSMVENLPAGAVFVDNESIEINPAVEAITGYFRSELTTLDMWYEKLYGSRQNEIRQQHDADRANGFPARAMTKLTRKDGAERLVEFTSHGFDNHEVWLMNDVTEKHLIQKELEREKAILEGIVNGVPDALLLADVDRRITFCNPAVERVFGYKPEELFGRETSILYENLEDFQSLGESRFRPDANEQIEPFKLDWRRKDGTSFPGEGVGTIIMDRRGKPLGFLGLIRDVTERNRIGEALRREHELSESLINTAQGIVLLLDMQGRIMRFNPYFESLTGWLLEDLKGLDWIETCIPKNERSAIRQRFNNAMSGTRTAGQMNRVLCRDGSIRTIEWYDAILCDNAGEQIGLLATGQDITERRALQRHLLQIADDEKRRIGHDLHDGLGQELTGLSMMADSLRLDLQDKSLPESKIAEKIAKQVDDSLQELRRLARGMDPVDIDPQGLESELTQLAIHVSSLYGIECTFTCVGRVVLGDSEIATNLFRIAQEAITNAAKHGKADKVEISIFDADGRLVLQVLDNGTGIANLEEIQTGVGMRSMRYRADVIGGAMHIEQRKQGGTAVTCTLPTN